MTHKPQQSSNAVAHAVTQRSSFEELGLSKPLLRGVEKAGYERPTPIQAATIVPALEGRDLVACAQTGTGKTAAFSLPLLQRVDELANNKYAIRALILTPTRELAAQIGDCLDQYSHDVDLEHTVIFGGVPDKKQVRILRDGVDIVVATPGRLLDLIQQGEVDLSDVGVLVLDEADRMLDMGFLPDVKRVLKELPKKKQTLLFSATMPEAIRSLANSLLVDPEYIAVTPSAKTADDVVQHVRFVNKKDKRQQLLKVLQEPDVQSALVFSRTKHGANKITKYLEQNGVRSAAIHGNKSQGARTKALGGFKQGSLRVLVATDIAARGIDVDGISHVINFDLPNEPETYVHRIGRTGRAGASGVAISLCDQEELAYLRDIERLTKQKLEQVGDEPDFDITRIVSAPPKSRSSRSGGRRGGRPGGQRGGRPGGQRGGRSSGQRGSDRGARAQSYFLSFGQEDEEERKEEMNKQLFVGGLAWATDDDTLHSAFAAVGEVESAKVITDRDTGRSRGFGFVTFANSEDAERAVDTLNGAEIDGRSVRVNWSESKGRR